jgi:hypothetical protein
VRGRRGSTRGVDLGGAEVALDALQELRVVYDLMGKDATLFHHAAGEDETSSDSRYVQQIKAWFDTVRRTISRPAER